MQLPPINLWSFDRLFRKGHKVKFKYYITDLHEGAIQGTNDDKLAAELSTSEDYFVLETETGMWLTVDGAQAVEEKS